MKPNALAIALVTAAATFPPEFDTLGPIFQNFCVVFF